MSRLNELLADMRAKQGSPEEQLSRQSALSRFLADLPPTARVFCCGEVRNEKGYYPAALTLNTIYGQVLAWAASGRKNAMESHSPTLFHSHIPYAAIAREVLDYPDTTAIAMETGTAIDSEAGVVAKP